MKVDDAFDNPLWLPSPEASAEGICHTKRECDEMYARIPENVRRAGAMVLRGFLAPKMDELIKGNVHTGGDYLDALSVSEPAVIRSFVGMSIRNFLRKNGFGERVLQVHNLDCVYSGFIRDAVQQEVDFRNGKV